MPKKSREEIIENLKLAEGEEGRTGLVAKFLAEESLPIIEKKIIVNDEIKVDIDGDGQPDITIKKTRFFKKGNK
jgi:hypothetical protein